MTPSGVPTTGQSYRRIADVLDALESLGNRATAADLRTQVAKCAFPSLSTGEIVAALKQARADGVVILDGGGVWQTFPRARRRNIKYGRAAG
jgi:hypothetical protein